MRKKRLQQKSRLYRSHSWAAATSGSTVVTYIHTMARKMVFPMAYFFRCPNSAAGILGAEYRNVSTAPTKIQGQWGRMASLHQKIPNPPIRNNTQCMIRYSIDQLLRWLSAACGGVSIQ